MAEQLGRYELQEKIGQGGFAVVYRATDTALHRAVALKELRPALGTDEANARRFEREARLIARLDHPRIVPIYDVGRAGERLFIVMRLISGPGLDERIAAQGRLPWAEAVAIITALAEGLDFAHGQGILHRDLKPANILLDPERGPLLSDFGLARLAGETSLSASGNIGGTPHYIAPEAWEGAPPGSPGDIYALGCILFEMLTGNKLIQGDSPVAVMSAHLKPVEFPAEWPAGVPSGVADVLRRALSKNPADRYPTAGDFAAALAELPAPQQAAPPGDRLEIFTFGGLRLAMNGRPLKNSGSRRVEALLLYLACTGRPQPRDLLADLLWDDRPQQQAMSNLRTVLSGLRKHFGPFVSITRDSAGLDPAANIWLDAGELAELAGHASAALEPDSAAQLGQAAARLDGEFLEGFYLRGARGFETWLTQERESRRQQLLDTLDQLAEFYLTRGAPAEGIAPARQRLHLDPLSEAGHRRLMRLLAADGQRSAALAQFESCRQILDDEFGVEPEAETMALVKQIRAGKTGTPAAPPAVEMPPPPELPAFLSESPPVAATPPLFVARNRELARLDAQLAAALDGNGQVALVTGEAGRGKTSLLAEFARRAQESHPALVAASGTCNAYSGLGDPYLPFRELLALLTGDVESRLAAGGVSHPQARRLWKLLPHSARALVERGPNLVETLVPGAALARRVAAAEHPTLAEQITALAEQARTPAGNLEQRQIFEQVGQVLDTLAARQPLLLILDDLQWADSASVSLLFHLARRLAGRPMMLVGAYRPIELQDGSGPPAPFAPVAGELKRLFGDIELDLGRTPAAEGREFVDALLDSEPNRLGESFRAAMFGQTQGHPLFTVELLREMQERGDLAQDEAGLWVEARPLDWRDLPARVEAVIEQRLARLDDDTQEMLAIAAVEGELFTGQVVARLHGVSERQLLRQLSRTLGKRHRLVRAQGEVTVGENRLSRFQFRHALFQQYLYQQLGPGERRLLHRDIAAVLEELHAGHTGEISVALARHYTEAGQGEQAIPHLLRAGDQARLAYAHQAAIEHYRQAVIFLKEQDDDERAADTLMKLGLTYHNAFQFEESRLAYDEAFALRSQQARPQPVPESAVERTLRVLWPDDPQTLDPALIDNSLLVGQLFSGLVESTSELDVVPDVARRWEILDGGRKYVFHLRDDVRWSDGTPVTAHDFEYAWKRILNPATGSFAASLLYDVKGARAFHRGETGPESVAVNATDAFTLIIELEHPTGYFLSLLTYSATYPVPRHAVETRGENWAATDKIVTCGPFRLKRWQRGDHLVLTRNETYHGQSRGNVDQIKCLFMGGDIWSIADWDDRSLALYEAGNLDLIRIAEAVGQARQRHAKDHVSFPMFWTIYVSFDMGQPPFDDLRVRQAFALAIDRERYQKEITRGLFVPAAGGFLPPEMLGHSPDIGLPYDPAQARRLLAEAGYPDGHGFPKVKALGGTRQEADYVQSQWRENLGIEVEWEVLDIVTAHETASRERPALFFVAWGADYPDPDSFMRVCFQQPYHNWHHKEYDKLVEQARHLTDQKQRLNLYRQADRILMEQIPLTPLFYGRLHFLVKPWVRNLRIAPTWEAFWKDIVIDPARQPARPQPAPKAATERTLRIAIWEPTNLDPALADDQNFYHQLFRGLVAETTELGVVPDVAHRWEILDGGRSYIFHLRPDARWSDGAPLTAADFEFAWQRVLNPATGAPLANLLYDVKNGRAFHQGRLPDAGQVGVRALDAATLAVELEEPTGYFLHLLACGTGCPVPRHLVEKHGPNWTAPEHIATNGPFCVERWLPGQSAVLRKNPHYHGSFSGNLERVELTISRWDSDANLKRYEAGELDVVLDLFPSEEMDRVRRRYAGDFIAAPGLQTTYIGFNLDQPPFDDVRVRQALALAIDKQALVSTLFSGYSLPADGGFIPDGMPGFSAGIGLPFDPDLARQRLAEAGFPKGQGFPAVDWLVLNWEPMAEYLRAQWRDVLGIHLSGAHVETAATLAGRLAETAAPLYLAGWVADFPDPAGFTATAAAYYSLTGQNAEYTRLVGAAARTTNQEARLDLYRQADRILVNEALVIPLTYGRMHLLLKPWVKKYPVSAANYWFWQDVVIAPDELP